MASPAPNDRIRSVHASRPAVPSSLDEILRRATAWDPAERYPHISDFVEGFARAIEGRDTTTAVSATAINPYKGLRPFEEVDAQFFFGRERLISEVIGFLGGAGEPLPFVTLIGASGSGKSSIVLAGVLPEVRPRRNTRIGQVADRQHGARDQPVSPD